MRSRTWTDDAKDDLYESSPLYQRKARSKGIPSLGSRAIYPMDEEDIVVLGFPIPDYYVRGYGLDVGWNRTAAIWGAKDLETGIIYLYAEYSRGQAEPAVHTEAIKGFGEWIPGVIDPATNARGQKDGVWLLQEYLDAGLNLDMAVNAVEAGILASYRKLTQGKLSTHFHKYGDVMLGARDHRRVRHHNTDPRLDCSSPRFS